MNNKDTSIESSYWNNFYNDFTFDIPSQFCVLTASETQPNTKIIEFGCGNGRDSIFFARHGYYVMAMDLSSEAIKSNIDKTSEMQNIRFIQGDISTTSDVVNAIAQIKNKTENVIIYSRFFLHSIDKNQETSFMKAIASSTTKGDMLYFEFRSKEDEEIDKIYGDHYRRFVDNNDFTKALQDHYNFEIKYNKVGQGMAKYKSEDPFVSRIIATKLI